MYLIISIVTSVTLLFLFIVRAENNNTDVSACSKYIYAPFFPVYRDGEKMRLQRLQKACSGLQRLQKKICNRIFRLQTIKQDYLTPFIIQLP